LKAKRASLLVAFSIFALISFAALGADRPPQVLRLQGEELVLNGFGERELWWTDVYRCALYLPKQNMALHAVRHHSTPKAITVRILFSDLPPNLPANWRPILAEELNRELMGKLKLAYRRLEQNDRITFFYAPRQGSTIWINDKQILSDPGHGLMLGLVDQWLGEQPVSKNLKRLLLRDTN